MPESNRERDWAWVAGASEGLGFAFAEQLATRGYNLVLIARRETKLRAAAEKLRHEFEVDVVTQVFDLADPDLASFLEAQLQSTPPSIGVYNAAYGTVAECLDTPLDNLLQIIDVGVRGPLIWARLLGEFMQKHDGGSLILMSSLAGEQGSPRVATYAAAKSFNTRLAEGLWRELHDSGVNVIACCSGAIRTPGYIDNTNKEAPGTMDAIEVARAALEELPNGPRVTPGWLNKLNGFLMGRVLPRRMAIRLMDNATSVLKLTRFD